MSSASASQNFWGRRQRENTGDRPKLGMAKTGIKCLDTIDVAIASWEEKAHIMPRCSKPPDRMWDCAKISHMFQEEKDAITPGNVRDDMIILCAKVTKRHEGPG